MGNFCWMTFICFLSYKSVIGVYICKNNVFKVIWKWNGLRHGQWEFFHSWLISLILCYEIWKTWISSVHPRLQGFVKATSDWQQLHEKDGENILLHCLLLGKLIYRQIDANWRADWWHWLLKLILRKFAIGFQHCVQFSSLKNTK